MKDIAVELNKEVCPVHLKHPQCNLTHEGVEIKACCREFRELLELNLREINKQRIGYGLSA